MNKRTKEVKIIEAIVLVLVLVAIFLLVYSPHFKNPYPIHIDEWHNIEQALKLKQGKILHGVSGLEIGFRAFLVILSFFADLVLIYKFLPALWAVFSALVLFYVVRKKTGDFQENESFLIALIAVIFFGSIKSNVNLTGLWFFTPMTFAIPFIFLYIYLFTEGIEKENSKMLLLSLLIMIFLIFAHTPSLLFSIPFLIVYCIFNIEKAKKQYKIFFYFLLVPIFGALFYKIIMRASYRNLILRIFNSLQFKLGWAGAELNNSPFEIYSLVGYILAFLGIIFIFYSEKIKEYLIFILWPMGVLLLIFIFKVSEISFLSPYQRNFYYFALSLPVLSSFGLYFIISLIKKPLNKLNLSIKNKKIISYLLTLALIIFVVLLAFHLYFDVPKMIGTYKLIDKEDYSVIKFLVNLPPGKVLAPVDISTTLFPISYHEPIATIYFQGNEKEVRDFFLTYDCSKKNNMIKKYNVSYVIFRNSSDCNWTVIYSKNNRTIYRV